MYTFGVFLYYLQIMLIPINIYYGYHGRMLNYAMVPVNLVGVSALHNSVWSGGK